MASLMENLIETLNQECIEYEGMIELSQNKTAIIVKGDLEALDKITEDEQVVIARLNQLEKKRLEVTKDIATVINKDVESLKIPNMIQMLEGRDKEQKSLKEVHARLKDVTSKIQDINQRNESLLKHALELIEFDMSLLQSLKKAPETANYNKEAYTDGTVMSRNSGAFDAKQ